MLELRIHGRGGQGVVTLADLLGKAALNDGKEAQALPFFGVERRGAAIKACVRISGEPILLRSMSYKPDIIALMHENMLPYARQEGFDEGEAGAEIIVNGREPVEAGGRQWVVDAERIARDHGLVFGGEAYINVPMLGAIARVMGLPLGSVEDAVGGQWQGKAAAPNLAAAKEAYEQVRPASAGGAADSAGNGLADSIGSGAGDSVGNSVGSGAGDGGSERAGAGRQDGGAMRAAQAAAASAASEQPLSRLVEGAGGATGSWRSRRPALDAEKCTGCLLCWIYCPEAVITREDRAIDYRYCKGCGICARECPAKAITMEREEAYNG
jgi:pyruvate ferredoxin oxidoreductase gamma subunit